MSKEELEKAIENGESVWYLYLGLYKINLIEHSKQFIDSYNHYCYTDKEGVERCCPLNNLFKTKAGAEHYLHHANITRTETLPFLTWEEFNEQKFIWFVDKKQNQCCLYYLNVSNKIFINVSSKVIELGDLTEENFYKAYDECVKLFMEVENE